MESNIRRVTHTPSSEIIHTHTCALARTPTYLEIYVTQRLMQRFFFLIVIIIYKQYKEFKNLYIVTFQRSLSFAHPPTHPHPPPPTFPPKRANHQNVRVPKVRHKTKSNYKKSRFFLNALYDMV